MKIRYKAAFLKAISKINDARLKNEIALAIEQVENAEKITQVFNVKKLKNARNDYRIRIGDYRIGLRLEEDTLIFAAFAHRKDFYRFFPR